MANVKEFDTALRAAALKRWLALCLVLLSSAGVAADLQTKHQFSIPAQALDTALLAFSDQAKVQVLMWAVADSNAKSAGAGGELSSLDALKAILANTGFGYRQV